MISNKLETAINNHINVELWSSYLYMSMATHFASEGYSGFANWFNVQAKEEGDHALILMNYLISRGGKVTFSAIKEVKNSWKTLSEALKETLEHEEKITSLIHRLYDLASIEKDYATTRTLDWFIDEQVEEEENVRAIVDKIKLIGESGQGLYMIDNEQATRIYTQALPLAGKLLK